MQALRALGVTLSVGLLAIPLGMQDAEAANRYAVEITASTLRVRSAVWGRILGHVHDGDRFVVQSQRSGWLQICWKGRLAWIGGSYARRVPADVVLITANRLNVRTGPSTRNRIIGGIPRNQTYVRLRRGTWSKIQFDAREAWVYSGYLRTPGAATAPKPTPVPKPTPKPNSPPAQPGGEQLLIAVQQRAMRIASAELAAGVRESPMGSNRGPRVNTYASTAGMRTGLPWCGFFAGFTYVQAASQIGRVFSGKRRLHSVEKCRSYFLYRNYVLRSTAERVRAWKAERERHSRLGNTRRWLAFRDSVGHRYASARSLPVSVYDSYRQLPLRAGDFIFWPRHIALVKSYDRSSGVLKTVEGNIGNRVTSRVFYLANARTRKAMMGFGRPAWGDFTR